MNQLLEQFLTEARDNLSYLDENLESLQDEGIDTDALFRAAHTLKGGAGLVGFESVQTLTHKAEDILDKFRHNEIAYSDKMLEVLYDIFDEVVEIVDAAEELGDIPAPNQEVIDRLANEAQKVLTPQNSVEAQEKKDEEVETPLNISTDAPIELQRFSHDAIAQIVNELPFEAPQLSSELLVTPTYYLMDFDLDVDTITLGNDPFYLLSLFDDELKLTSLEIAKNCQEIEQDPLKWATRILAIVESDEETIEDICENILEEITLYPIGKISLFETTKQSGGNELLDEFKDELSNMLQNRDFSMLDEHISASLKLLNPDSKEVFVLLRLQALLTKFDLESDEFYQLLNYIAAMFEIQTQEEDISFKEEIVTKECSNQEDDEVCEAPLQNMDETSKKAVQNILNQQKQILSVANDEETLKRVKYTIETVIKSQSVTHSLNNLDNANDLSLYIDRLLLNTQSPQAPAQEVSETIEEPTPIKTQKTQSVQEGETGQESKTPQKVSAIGKTVKIDQYQIDGLMDNIGELLVMKNSMPYIVDTMNQETLEQSKRDILIKYDEISRVTSQLQETVMGMRLLPLSYIFGRYPKLVRDLSKKLNKKIRYEEEGGETKLDKTMIENLADPMVHLIRNSLDHGIEESAKRLERGKDETGVISIKAHSEGDKVIINIGDDGNGIDPQVIMNKALENNLIDAEKADSMTKEEILGLIFYSGLTTKTEISDLSGRGVGMDAVRTAIEKLNGNITVTSEIGEGTNIKLELPVSVALTNVFHIKMNETDYAVAMDYLIETSQVAKEEIQESNKRLFIQRRGELVPIIYPKSLIAKDADEREIQKMIVLQVGEKKFAVVVDEFVNQLDVVQKPLAGALKKHPTISGSSLLGNGSVLFILDVNKLATVESWR